MEALLAANSRPLGPVATAIVAGIIITGSVLVAVSYFAIEIRWRLAARRERRAQETLPPSDGD